MNYFTMSDSAPACEEGTLAGAQGSDQPVFSEPFTPAILNHYNVSEQGKCYRKSVLNISMCC